MFIPEIQLLCNVIDVIEITECFNTKHIPGNMSVYSGTHTVYPPYKRPRVQNILSLVKNICQVI